MPKQPLLNANPFVGPRQAFDVLGSEVFGDEWRPDCIEDPNDNEHREVLNILRNALRSGDVSAHWSSLDFKHSGDLRPQDANEEFFRFILHDDLVFHCGINQPVRCSIHVHQLRRLLRGEEVQPATPTQRAKLQCFEWLTEMFAEKDREIPPFVTLRQKAKGRFPNLSDLAFKEVRKLAIEKTGRHDLAKAGRRKNSISK